MKVQVSIDVWNKMIALESTMTSRLRDLVRINRPIFNVFEVEEDPQ